MPQTRNSHPLDLTADRSALETAIRSLAGNTANPIGALVEIAQSREAKHSELAGLLLAKHSAIGVLSDGLRPFYSHID